MSRYGSFNIWLCHPLHAACRAVGAFSDSRHTRPWWAWLRAHRYAFACHVGARTMAATGRAIGHLRSTAGANDDRQHLHRIQQYNGNWRSAPRPHYIEAANLPIGSNGAAYWEASRTGRRLRLLRIKGFALTPSIKTRQALTRQQALHRSPRSARDPRGRSFSARGCSRASARGYRRSSPAPHA